MPSIKILSETLEGDILVNWQVLRIKKKGKLVGFRIVHENGNVFELSCREPDAWWSCSCFEHDVSQSECYHAKTLREHFKLPRSLGPIPRKSSRRQPETQDKPSKAMLGIASDRP
jgi:hypothetical protein